jgi:hypothetical protein
MELQLEVPGTLTRAENLICSCMIYDMSCASER